MATKKAKKIYATLSSDMERKVVAALQRSWNSIAHDYLRDVESHSMTAEEIQELTGDYIDTHGGDKEAAKWFWAISYEDQARVLKLALPNGASL